MGAVYPEQNNPPLGYGSDLSCLEDLASNMAEVSGRTCLAYALARRLQTPRGGLLDDPSYGYDLTDEIDDDLTSLEIARIASNINAECVKDERVLSASTQLTFISGVLVASIDVTDRQGPYKLVLAATTVTVEVLKVAA